MSQLSTTVSKPSTKKSGPKSTNPLEGFDEKLIARVKQIQAALGSNAPSVDIIVLHLNENKNNIDRTVLSILESVQNHTEWIGQQRPPKKLKNLPPAPSQGKSERHHTAVPNWERNRSKANEPPGASNRQGNFTEKSSARNEGGNRPQGQNKRVEGSRWGSGLEKKSASERTQEKDPVNKMPNSTSEDASLDKNINMAVPEPIQEKEESGKEEPCPPSKKSAGQHAAAVITVYAPMKKVGEVSVDQKPTTFLDALKKGTPAATTTSAVVAQPSKVSPPNVPQKERTAKPTTVSSKPHAPRNTNKGGNRKAGRGHTAATASHHDTSSTTQDHHREPKTHPETSADSDVGKRSEDCVTEVQKQITPPKERHSDPSVNHQTPVMETTITSDPNLNPVVNPTTQARSRAVVTKKAMTGVEGPIAVSGSSDGNRFCHEEAHHSNPIVDSVPNASTRFIALRIRSDLEIFSSSLNANDSSRMLRAQPTLAVVSGASRVPAQQYAVDPNLHSSNRTNQGEKHMKIQHENILPQPGVHTKDSNYPHRINKVQYHGPSNEHMADSRGISFLANAVNHAFSNQQNGTSLWNFTSGGRAPPVSDRHTQCPTPEVVESIRHVPHDNGDAEASMPYREGMHHPMPESMTGLMPQVPMYNHSVVPHERSDTPTSAHEGSQFSTSSSNTRNVNISSGYENDPWGMQLNPQYHSGPGRYHLPGSNLNSSMMNGNNFLGQQNAPSQNQLPFRTQPTNPNYGNRNTNYHHTQQHSLHSSVNNFAGSRHGVAPGNAGNQNYYNSGYHHMNTGSRNASVHGQPSTISSHGIPPHSLNHINSGTTSVKPVVHQVSVADNAQHAFGNMGTSSNNSNNHMVGKGPVSKGPNGSSMNERNAQSAAHYYSFGDISHGIGNQAPLSSATGGAASIENARSMTSWNSYIAGSAAGTNHEDAAHPKNSLPNYASATPMFPYGFNNTSSPNTNSMSASGSKRQPNAPPAPFTNPFTSTNVGNNTMAHNTGSSNDSNAKTRGVMGTNENGGHGAALNHPNRSQSRGNNNNSNVQSRGKQGTASNHHASALSSSYSVTGDAARHLSESEWNMN